MQRGDNKLSQSKRKLEEIDKRLREAGIYDEGYSLETKTKLLEMVEESMESARQQEEEQQNLKRIMAESLNDASSQMDSDQTTTTTTTTRSTSSSSTRKKEKPHDSSPEPVQEPEEPRPSTSSKADPRCRESSPVVNTRSQRSDEEEDDDDEDLFVLSHKKGATKAKSSYSPSKVIVRRLEDCPKGVNSPKTYTPKHRTLSSTSPSTSPSSFAKTATPYVNKRKATTSTPITSTTKQSPRLNGETGIQSPNKSPQKVIGSVSGTPLTPRSDLTPSKNSPANSQHSSDLDDSSVIERSPSPLVKKHVAVSPRPSPSSKGGSSRAAVITPSPLKQSHTSTPLKQPTTSPVKRNLNTSFNQESSSSIKSPSSGTSRLDSNTAVSPAATTPTRTATLPSRKLDGSPVAASENSLDINECVVKLQRVTRNNALSIGPDRAASPPKREVRSESSDEEFQDAPAAPPLKSRTTTRFRGVEVFGSRSDNAAPLRRKTTPHATQPDEAFCCASNESNEQCRDRILKLMNAMALRLHQYQSSLLPDERLPVLVDLGTRKAKPSTARLRQKVQSVDDDFEADDFQPRVTRRTKQFQEVTEEPVAGPSSSRGTSRVRRTGLGRPLGPKRTRTGNATPPPPPAKSDSESDLEIALPSILFYPKSQDKTEEDTERLIPSKTLNQPSQRRRTFEFGSASDSSDNETNAKVTKTKDSVEGGGPSREGNAAVYSSNSSELCLFEDHPPLPSQHSLQSLPRGSPRGVRRPGSELPDETPSKLRKTQALLSQDSPPLRSGPEKTAKPPSHSPVYESIPNEDANEREKSDSDATLNLEEATEEIEVAEEEEEEDIKIPCPLCQVLYSMKVIQEHASDCTGVESPEHHQPLTRGSRRQRVNDESAVAIVSGSDGNDR